MASIKITNRGSGGNIFGSNGSTIEVKVEVNEAVLAGAYMGHAVDKLTEAAQSLLYTMGALGNPLSLPETDAAPDAPEEPAGDAQGDEQAAPDGDDLPTAEWPADVPVGAYETPEPVWNPDGADAASQTHPSIPEVERLLASAVLTFDEADTVRRLALAGQKRGEASGITHGR